MSAEHATAIGKPSSNHSPALSPQRIAEQLQQVVRDFQAIIPRAVEKALRKR